MSKFTCLVLCVVAANLSSVHVAKAQSLRESLRPAIVACLQEYGVADSAASIKPCFLSCMIKKTGFLNDKGDFDLDSGLKNLKQFVKDDEQYNKLAEVAKQCSSVYDKTMSTAACKRAGLLAGCFFAHSTGIII